MVEPASRGRIGRVEGVAASSTWSSPSLKSQGTFPSGHPVAGVGHARSLASRMREAPNRPLLRLRGTLLHAGSTLIMSLCRCFVVAVPIEKGPQGPARAFRNGRPSCFLAPLVGARHASPLQGGHASRISAWIQVGSPELSVRSLGGWSILMLLETIHAHLGAKTSS